MSNELFGRLLQRARQDGVIIQNAESARFIARHSAVDAALMSDSDIAVLPIGRRVRVVRIQFQGELYFCLFGIAEPDELPGGIESIDLTPGIFNCSVLAAKIFPSSNGLEIKQAIELDFMGCEGYGGHELSIIASLFPRAYVYKGSKNYDYHSDLYRIVGTFFSRTFTDGPIVLEAETILALTDFFESGSKFIPYGNMVRGMLAISWESLFLEAYRCIEQIYSCTKVDSLRASWASSRSLRDLSILLEDHLSWRPKEEDALSSILQTCSATTIRQFCNALNIPLLEKEIVDGVETERQRPDVQLAKSVAKNIYSMRNQIVHYRPIHAALSKSDDEWNSIIRLMLQLVTESYDRYGAAFFDEMLSVS